MKPLEIGVATITYSVNGTVLRATFVPSLAFKADQDFLTNQLTPATRDQGAIQQNAELVFASWFNKINEIELADREEFEVASEIITCEKWASGLPKICVIKFIFKHKNQVNASSKS